MLRSTYTTLHLEKLAKSAEEAAFVGDLGEVYKIIKKFVYANTKADPPVIDLNGNILSTDVEKLNRCREHFESVLNHVLLYLLQLQKLFHQLEAYHKLLPVNRQYILPSNLFPLVKLQMLMEYQQTSQI